MPEKMATPVFNEDKLGAEIERVWGAYGAHAEVYSMLRNEILRMERERDAAVALLRGYVENEIEDGRARLVRQQQAKTFLASLERKGAE